MKKILVIVLTALLYSCNYSDAFNPTQKDITIYGLVSDSNDGSPLANVTIRDEHTEVGSVGSTVTGYDGTYEFHLSPIVGVAMILAEKEGYETQTYSVILNNVNQENTMKVDFKLRRATIQYKGVVMETSNIPISNAKVYATKVQGGSRDELGTTFTDENGEYTLFVPNQEEYYSSWSYSVTASKDGYKSKTVSMGHTPNDNGKNFIVNFQLEQK